jgi:hypothetical protein
MVPNVWTVEVNPLKGNKKEIPLEAMEVTVRFEPKI